MNRIRILFGLRVILALLALVTACAPSTMPPATLPATSTAVQKKEATPTTSRAAETGTPVPKPEQEEVSEMNKRVTAEVILRSADGSSILDAKGAITAENIAKYRVGKEVIDKATKKLQGLGFRVEQVGPVGFTISGDKALFEKVFQTTLEAQSQATMGTKTSAAETSFYTVLEPIKIPEDLSTLIADVALATPPEFFP